MFVIRQLIKTRKFKLPITTFGYFWNAKGDQGHNLVRIQCSEELFNELTPVVSAVT